MANYNPQIKVEINEILPDGSDIPFAVDFFEGADQNYHAANKPIHISCRTTNSLGGGQNSASISIRNPLYLEKFRKDPQAELAKFKGKKLRVRIWAWYDDNGTTALGAQPFNQPVFVGDALEGFSVSSQGVNETSIEIQAQGHAWLATSGKMRKTWEPGVTYLQICEEIMLEFIENRGQGQEDNGQFPHFVVDDFPGRLEGKILESPLTINRNPMELLNDICRDLDYVWGVHNNIPYIVSRERPSRFDKLLVGAVNQFENRVAIISGFTSMSGLINYGTDTFSFSHNFDHNLFIGRVVEVNDEPQTGERGTLVAGRVNQITGSFDNRLGHNMLLDCSYLTNYTRLAPLDSFVVLPERRADNSGLRDR